MLSQAVVSKNSYWNLPSRIIVISQPAQNKDNLYDTTRFHDSESLVRLSNLVILHRQRHLGVTEKAGVRGVLLVLSKGT